MKSDISGRYPIKVVAEEGIDWNEGLKQIAEAAAAVSQHQHPSIIYTTATPLHLKMEQSHKKLAKVNADELINEHDGLIELTIGDCHYLGGTYDMMKISPKKANEKWVLTIFGKRV